MGVVLVSVQANHKAKQVVEGDHGQDHFTNMAYQSAGRIYMVGDNIYFSKMKCIQDAGQQWEPLRERERERERVFLDVLKQILKSFYNKEGDSL